MAMQQKKMPPDKYEKYPKKWNFYICQVAFFDVFSGLVHTLNSTQLVYGPKCMGPDTKGPTILLPSGAGLGHNLNLSENV